MKRATTFEGEPSDPLERGVFLYLEEREQGIVSDWAQFERRHPDSSTPELRSRIAALEAAGLVAGSAAPDSFPETLGDFRLLERLGGGGMGVVFRAEQRSLGRVVALKLIRPEQLYFPRARERFRREIEAVARLAHPGIVPVYASGEENGLPYYAMELIDGLSLASVLRAFAGRDPAQLRGADVAALFPGGARAPLFDGSYERLALELARQIALALQHAHARGVLHRDVKPSNVVLSADGRARLLDFGLAARSGATRLTGTGVPLGSISYMAPEVASGAAQEGDVRADVYGLGVSLYELLTLRLPFDAPTAAELSARIQAGQPTPPRQWNEALSRDAQTVCLCALELEPARRYASAQALADDLGSVLELRPIAARPASSWRKLERWTRRHPARASSLALGLVILLGGPLSYGLVQARAAEEQRALNEQLAAANRSLEERGAELAATLQREARESERATVNFERARRAVDEMLAEVGGDTLRHVPQAEEPRRKLLEKALAFYEQLSADEGPQAAVRRERARTERTIGDLQQQLGRFEEADARYAQASASLRALCAEDPSTESWHTLSSVLGQHGANLSKLGRADEARAAWLEALDSLQSAREAAERENLVKPLIDRERSVILGNLAFGEYAAGNAERSLELHQQALAIIEPLLVVAPEDAGVVLQHGIALANVAGLLQDQGRGEEARIHFDAAHEALDAAHELDPEDVRTREQLIELANNHGLQLLVSGDPQRAERVLGSGLEAARSLCADFPYDPEMRRSLAALALNYGVQIANMKRYEEADAIVDEARELLERLAIEHPERFDFGYFLGATCMAQAGIAVELGNLNEAAPAAARSIEILRASYESSGGHLGVQASLASAYFVRGDVERAQGELDAAYASLEEGFAFGVERPDVVFMGTVIFGSLALAAREASAGELQASCVERGLTELERAIAAGFQDPQMLREEEKLELLRADARFAALCAPLEALKE
jgi:serine/threonine protein kinase